MKILFDANVLLDVLLKREQTFQSSYQALLKALDENDELLFCSSSIADVYYVLRKALKDKESAKEKLKQLLSLFTLIPLDGKMISKAFSIGGKAFEDDIVLSMAMASKADLLVSQNCTDFKGGFIKVESPTEFLAQSNQGDQ